MVLLHVKKLLEGTISSQTYIDCLILLRRQRIDLNILIDFDPMLFVNGISDFIGGIALKGPTCYDLVSLLVTSLEEEDTVKLKYPILLKDKL